MHEFILFANELLTRPMVLVLGLCVFFLIFLKMLKLDFPGFVVAVNSVGSQPFALVVMVIGFWMLVQSKKAGIDTTIAGAVIGVASNMLQAQIKDATHPPPGAAVKTSTTTEFQTPPPPSDVIPASTPAPLQGRAYQNINTNK